MLKTVERNNQIVIELLKKHKIKKIVVSPGGTNVSFIANIQNDPFFEIYSVVDERSAAYIACGLAEESGECVVLSCTGATAARNYFSGLTEAYYSKLPILAITSTLPIERIGHNVPQLTDRRNVTNDIVKKSFHLPLVKDEEDEWYCMLNANDAMLELKHHYSGPVHINLETNGLFFEEIEKFQDVNYIERLFLNDKFMDIKEKKVAIYIGRHSKMSKNLVSEIDLFCEKYNAVVIGDHTSNYSGKYMIPSSLVACQNNYHPECVKIDLLIHLGNISGAYLNIFPKKVWRVNSDGKLCDNFKKLTAVFEMEEIDFFKKYNLLSKRKNISYFEEWKKEYDNLYSKIPNLPFSNIYVANKLSKLLPKNSVIHLGILNSLRSWNFFEIDRTISVYANTGGFGIDGCVSSLLGASLINDEKTYFGIFGDLAFFYDINCLGNRHFGNNVRIIVINNGLGQEFKNYGCRAYQFKEDTNKYIAAEGHNGNKSKNLIKNFANNLGFDYISASSKDEFENNIKKFLCKSNEKSIIFEIFTDTMDETKALKIIQNLESEPLEKTKEFIKNIIGQKNLNTIKKIVKR